MRLALDTNILSALFRGEPSAEAIVNVLEAQPPETLVIHGTAFCEFLAGPGIESTLAFAFLRDTGVHLDLDMPEEVWWTAASAFKAYAERRRRSGSGRPRRILADFLIGAHAEKRAGILLTLDPQHYRLSFPALRVIDPTT